MVKSIRGEGCFNYLGYLFLFGNIVQVIDPGITPFRVWMICGIIISSLSEKGLWRKSALGLNIFVGLVYFMTVELMRIIFQGNGF